MRTVFIISLLCTYCLIIAGNSSFGEYIQDLINQDPQYQYEISQLEKTEADILLHNSLKLADLNIYYQKYLNEIERNEERTESIVTDEISLIDERDSRWRIELSRKFFPTDFDNVEDDIDNSLDQMEHSMKLIFTKARITSNIFADVLKWYEAKEMLCLTGERIELLTIENEKLTELEENKILAPKDLIGNLEELEKKERKYQNYQTTISLLEDRYDLDLDEFINLFLIFISQEIPADTLVFQKTCKDNISMLNKKASRMEKMIAIDKYISYLPELTASLSYNWRQTNQDWDITTGEEISYWDRDQKEEYPEIKLKLSLPLNISSNYSGKKRMIDYYRAHLEYLKNAYQEQIRELMNNYTSELQAAENSVIRKKQLLRLYKQIYQTDQARLETDPEIIDDEFKMEMMRKEYDYKEALLKYKLAEMKLYNMVYLINSFGEIDQ